MFKPFMSKLT